MIQERFIKMVVVMFMFTLCSFTFKFGGIGVNGDVMRVVADAEIQKITLVGDNGKIYVFPGCGEKTCLYNIKDVAVGCYSAVMETIAEDETGYACKR